MLVMLTSIAITTVAGRVPPPPPNGTSVVVAVPLAQGTTVATLPAAASLNRTARVRLRFVDAPLRSRGSNAWNYTVTFRLAPLNNGVAGNSQTSSLTIFRGLDRESFEAVAVLSPLNGNGAQIEVTAISTLGTIPAGIVCEVELTAEPAATFASSQLPSITLQTGPPAIATLASVPASSVSYEFEWVFYDEQEPRPIAPFASRDAVRIATATPQAPIDTTYPAGTLYVRGRALGRFGTTGPDSEARRSGRWSNALTVPIGANAMTPALNWNYVAGFAEGSDAVSSVGFFDGAFRNRQSQTRVGSRGSRLVAETKLDREGRSPLTFLPAPIAGLRFDYVPRFNAVDPPAGTTASQPYDANHFDGVMPATASAASGAGHYYSPGGTTSAPQDAYVPAADGYPFSLTEPARDDSGRPRRISGVGKALRLGGGHDVLFRYGTASSSPLRQLFGRNVGRAAYYERNVVIDANRQAHVAYVDRGGRVIATALTGGAPHLASIAPATLPVMTYRLDENNVVDPPAGVSRSVNRVTVEETTDLFFAYDLGGIDYSVPGSVQFPAVCESCRYRLRIRVLDANGENVALRDTATPQTDPLCTVAPERQEIESVLGATAPQQTSCQAAGVLPVRLSSPASPGPVPVTFCAKLTEPGEYEVIKELTLIAGAVDTIVTKTLSTPGRFDLITYRPNGKVVEQQCHQDCAAFCSNVTATGDLNAQCLAKCRSKEGVAPDLFELVANRSCQPLEQQIRADVAPGGVLAGRAVSDHPEYCRIRKLSPVTPSICQRSIATDTFDYRMTSVATYQEALCRGYLDPLQGTPGAPARPATCTGPAEHDPFIDAVQIGRSLRGPLEAILQDYTGRMPGFTAVKPPLHESIWQVAARPVQPWQRPPTDDERWRMFRSLYMGAKQTVLVKHFENPKSDDFCPYWNDKHAHVKRPYTFTTIGEAEKAVASTKSSYCADQCPDRARQWIADLEAACTTTIPAFYKGRQLAPNLSTYCKTTCEAGGPGHLNALPIITTTAVATDPSLIRSTQPVASPPYQLPQGCTLDRIAKPASDPPGGPIGSVSASVSLVGQTADPRRVAANAVDARYQFPPPPKADMCLAGANAWADQQARLSLEVATGDLRTFVQEQHFKSCFGSQLRESFSYRARQGEFHFTLHYFDQAGDLVQTVPPAGVRPLSPSEIALVEDGTAVRDPSHTLAASYRHNSLGQVLLQETPDSGAKRFWYNGQGQLRLSQNAQQQLDGRYAFVRYDRRGRVIETGLVANAPDRSGAITPLDQAMLQTYADDPDFPAGFTREQTVTKSYDRPAAACQGLDARNLRGRIAAIVAATTIGVATTCYGYDPHGNITALSQTVPGLGTKTTAYEYDILDGRLLATHYQPGENDEIHHRYSYDADRRLATVETSRDGELWERDAAYSYYHHGPLARVELGADRVQGLDYTYALTDWPKGVNSDTLTPERDPGQDGRGGAANAGVARDAFGSAVHYFPNDYRPVGTALTSATLPNASTVSSTGELSALAGAPCAPAGVPACGLGLFDGNIAATVSAIANAHVPGAVVGTSYRYDQLYRLRASTTFGDVDAAANRWPLSSNDPRTWRTSTSYDANGNINRLQRYAATLQGGTSALMDDLTYHYPRDASNNLGSNRLSAIHDGIQASAFPDDLDAQTPDNYVYDASGRLTRDGAAGLKAIAWNAAGQVATIDRVDDTIEFVYDGLGNRIAKIVRAGNDPTTWKYEYFVRDHRGEIVATYKSKPPGTPLAQPAVALADHTIVGVRRLGTWAAPTAPSLQTSPAVGLPGGIVPPPGGIVPPPSLFVLTPNKRYTRVRGDKQYELANYLGNVEATITDRKVPIEANGVVTHYEAQQVNTSGYYPFGTLMPGLGTQAEAYRFGFSGLERDDELKGSGNSYYTSARLFDPRVGRWLSPDPAGAQTTSPFVGFANNPLRYSDPGGKADNDVVSAKQQQAWLAKQNRYAGLTPEAAEAWKDVDFGDWWQHHVEEPVLKPITTGLRWTAGIVDPTGIVESELDEADTNIGWGDTGGGETGRIIRTALSFLLGHVSPAALEGTAARTAERSAAGELERLGALPCGSFGPETLVQVDGGFRPIADIKVGDFVLSGNEATGERELRRVDASFSRLHASSVRLAIRDEDGTLEQITTTLEHPFWVEDKGWTPAGEIAGADTRILGINGWRTVEHADHIPGWIVEYDLTVNGLHTFFVGTSGTWVHNARPPCRVQLKNSKTGRFIPDPAHPKSPYVFTDAERRAAWKRLANDPTSGLSAAQRAEIEARGWRGPQRVNPQSGELETMELSHEPVPKREAGKEVVPRWPEEHAAVDPHRQLKKKKE